jgi:ribosomal protein L4
MKLLIKFQDLNKTYNIVDLELTNFCKNFRIYKKNIFQNIRQITYPKPGSGMRQVKHISGPGRGMSRQPKNRTLGSRTIHVPNAVGGRDSYHYPTSKTYLKTNKKLRFLLFQQLFYKLFKNQYLKFIPEKVLTEKNKTSSILQFLKNSGYSNFIKNNSKQSILLFADSKKTYLLSKNLQYILCFNLKDNQEIYKIDIESLDNKLVVFTLESLSYILNRYKLLNE